MQINGSTMLFVLIVIEMFLFLAMVITIIDYIKEIKKEKKDKLSLIKGLPLDEEIKLIKQEKKKEKTIKRKTKKYPFKKIINEYLFFGGSKGIVVRTMIIGYGLFFVVYFLISKNVLISLIFSIFSFLIFYLRIDSINKKRRMKYLRSFSSALEVLSSSIEAGNSLESAIFNVQNRESLDTKIRHEFTTLANNLKSSMSLEESLEAFWQRNNLFEEFSMFVIVLSFFVKSGGSNLKKMFLSMKTSINQKIENYSLIDSKIGMYKILFKIFIIVEIAFTFVGPLIITNFYGNLSNGVFGYIKALGSVILTFLSCWLFNTFIRNSAEA